MRASAGQLALPLGRAKVDDHAALVAVQAGEIGVVRPDVVRADAAGDVAAGRLDFDHVGAKVGQQQPAIRPGQHVADFQDANAGEGPVHASASARAAMTSASAISAVKIRRTPRASSSG